MTWECVQHWKVKGAFRHEDVDKLCALRGCLGQKECLKSGFDWRPRTDVICQRSLQSNCFVVTLPLRHVRTPLSKAAAEIEVTEPSRVQAVNPHAISFDGNVFKQQLIT